MPFFGPPGGSGGGGGVPTFTAPETVSRGDRLLFNPKGTDTIQRSDRLLLAPARFTETLQRGDVYLLPTTSIKAPETLRRGDEGIFRLDPWYAQPPTGTPNTDSWGDAWTDAAIGQTGVNHGTTHPLDCTNLVTGERRGFIEIDFTRLTGLTGVEYLAWGGAPAGTACKFTVVAQNASPLLAVVMTVNIYAQAARWFTESTINQSNQPAPSGPVYTGTFSVGAAGAFYWDNFLSIAQLDLLLGKWVLAVFTTPALTVSTMSVFSRENGNTISNGPFIAFKAKRT